MTLGGGAVVSGLTIERTAPEPGEHWSDPVVWLCLAVGGLLIALGVWLYFGNPRWLVKLLSYARHPTQVWPLLKAVNPVVWRGFGGRSAMQTGWVPQPKATKERTQLQEYVEADADLRITVVGDVLYAAAIDSRETDYPIDFRMSLGQADVRPVELPDNVIRVLRSFMSRLGLVYGAIDMRRTPSGEYVFLEINTAGEFLFVEDRTGQPITRAVASLLAASGETRSTATEIGSPPASG